MVLFIIFFLFVFGVIISLFRNRLSYVGLSAIVLSVSIPDLYYVPAVGNDLYSYYKEMGIICNYNSLHLALNSYKQIPALNYHSYEFIYNSFEWCISRTGVFSLLPFLSVFIVYNCLCIPAIHQRLVYNMSFRSEIFIILAIVSLFPYITVTSTIRWELASSLFFLLVYIMCNVSNRYRWILLVGSIPLFFIHEGMIVPIILLSFCLLLKRIRIKTKGYYIIIFAIITMGLNKYILSSYTNRLSNNVFDIASKYSHDSFGFSFSESAILGILAILCYSLGSFILIKYNSNLNLSMENNLFWMFNFITLCSLPSIVIFFRYIIDAGIIDILIYLEIKKHHGNIPYTVNILYMIAIFLLIIIFIYNSHSMYFNLSQLYSF